MFCLPALSVYIREYVDSGASSKVLLGVGGKTMDWTTVLTALFASIGGARLTATLALRNARRGS